MKVYGNGFLAKHLKKISLPKKIFIYAAGVSNSNLRSKKEYLREIKVFKRIFDRVDRDKIFIYISTLSVENKILNKDPYVKNKIKIERLIVKNSNNYLIIRLPQLVGNNKNKYTLTNSIYKCFIHEKKFNIWKNSKRNLIDIDDFIIILKKFLKKNKINNRIVNIFNYQSIEIVKLLKIFSSVLKKKIKVKLINKNNKNINLKGINKKTLLPKFYYNRMKKKDYIKKIILKYYT